MEMLIFAMLLLMQMAIYHILEPDVTKEEKAMPLILLNELKLKFESLTCKAYKNNKVANKLFTNLGTKVSEDDKFNYYAF